MDLNQLPIHQRLDALINRFENSDSESDAENRDYEQFVDRQAANALTHEITPAQPESLMQEGTGLQIESDSNFSSDSDDDLHKIDDYSDSDEEFSDKSGKEKKTTNAHDKIIQSIYKEAGITFNDDTEKPQESEQNRSVKPRKRTAKQIEREREAAARSDSQIEREMAPEIAAHTVKTFAIKDFSADLGLSASEDEDEEASKPENKLEKPKGIIVSSPPRPQAPLVDFLSSPRPPIKPINDETQSDFPSSSPVKNAKDVREDADDDLEIIPETKMAKLSRPVRDMSKFAGNKAGGTVSDRKFASEFARLAQLEQQQISDRRRRNKESLAAQGVDVDAINETIESKQRSRAGGAEALLAQEQQKAEESRQLERARRQDNEISDIESEFESSSDDETEKVVRRKSVSDDDDDDDNDDKSNENHIKDKKGSLEARNPIKASKFVDESNGTQYLPPLSPGALEKIMGLDDANDTSVRHEDTIADGGNASNPQSALEDTLQGTLQDTFATQESIDEELEIVRNDTVRREVITPDLTKLNRSPPDQRLAAVRQRYLEAKAEQRRQLYFEKQQQAQSTEEREQNIVSPPANKKFGGAKFVEDQAEESEDEENDIRGLRRRLNGNEDDEDDEDDANNNADLDDLVDKSQNVKLNSEELKRRYLEEEKLRDQKLLNKFVDGVHGGFRRQRQRAQVGDKFLSDDDSEFSDDETNHRSSIEAQRKSSLLKSNQQVAQLVSNQKAAAFFTSISEDLVSRPRDKRATVQEGLDFLRSFDQTDYRGGASTDITDSGSENDPYDVEDFQNANLLRSRDSQRKVSVSRPRTISERSQQIVKGRTYASRISSSDFGNSRDLEITSTLGRVKKPSKPKARYVAPSINVPNPKRRPVIAAKFNKASWD